MIAALRLIVPRGIGGQIVLLLLATLVISQALTVAFVLLTDAQRNPVDNNIRAQLRAISAVIRMIAFTPEPMDRRIIIDAANRSNPDINILIIARPGASEPPEDTVSGPAFIQRDLGVGFDVAVDPAEDRTSPRTIFVTLPDGSALQAELPFVPPPPSPLDPRINIGIFAGIGAVALLLWATRVLSVRLRNFARAVADFSPEGDHDPLPETGPSELRTVAAALNRMRDRIAALVKTRTLMLTAVGHDLRTPVTRLRLRSEFVQDGEMRSAMLRDLDHMTNMIDAVLALLRDPRALAPAERIDLAVFLRTLCDDFADTGKIVIYEGPQHCSFVVREDDLRRAMTNLVDNALRHGTHARVSLVADAAGPVHLRVDDDGPGIAPEERELMLQPFVRGDAARSGDHDGFGLGLAIATSAVNSHGGTLTLADSDLGGLRVEITLPVRAARPAIRGD
ncbi:MAG TPA: ATP-binding protein [Devosiaceae bacterium]|jgi:signal transduction histidine kinase